MPRNVKNTESHYRQGDILLVRISELPKGAVKDEFKSIIVLGEGEVAGHRHEIRDTLGVSSYHQAEGFYLTVEEETEVIHPEHERIALLPGSYEVIRQSEFARREFQKVQD